MSAVKTYNGTLIFKFPAIS